MCHSEVAAHTDLHHVHLQCLVTSLVVSLFRQVIDVDRAVWWSCHYTDLTHQVSDICWKCLCVVFACLSNQIFSTWTLNTHWDDTTDTQTLTRLNLSSNEKILHTVDYGCLLSQLSSYILANQLLAIKPSAVGHVSGRFTQFTTDVWKPVTGLWPVGVVTRPSACT